MPCSSPTEQRVAVLAVGQPTPTWFSRHMDAALALRHGLHADVYAVTDVSSVAMNGSLPLMSALPFYFGRHLKALGLMSPLPKLRVHSLSPRGYTAPVSNATFDQAITTLSQQYPAVTVSAVPPLPKTGEWASSPEPLRSCNVQYYRLQECWRLMLEGEASRPDAGRYRVVVKLRFDVTPLFPSGWHPCRVLSAAGERSTIHAASDLVFWGGREAMAVAAATWSGMHTNFFRSSGAYADPLRRPFSVESLLRSMLATPPEVRHVSPRSTLRASLASIPSSPTVFSHPMHNPHHDTPCTTPTMNPSRHHRHSTTLAITRSRAGGGTTSC
jgi:hypothetical protein